MRLLILSPISPLPIFSGGRTRLYHITRCQARRHQVTFVSFCRNEEERAGLRQLERELDIRVITIPFTKSKALMRHPLDGGVNLARAYLQTWRRGWPPAVSTWHQSAMKRALQAELARQQYDVMQVEWPYLASYAFQKDAPATALITYDVFSLGIARRARLARSVIERRRLARLARRWRAYEAFIYPRFDLVAAMSADDAAIIAEIAPQAQVIVSPNGVDARTLTPGEMRPRVRDLLFVGSPTHAPNLDAACWLLTDIWPRLKRRRPQLHLTLVNLDHARVRACAAGRADVRITGRLPDLTQVYRKADIALAPLRAGSGTRLKILEAFALGAPVVSTGIGCEGLEVTPGLHLLRADAADDFVAAIEQLIDSPKLRLDLTRNARRLVEARYDWSVIVDRLDADYWRLLHAPS